MALHTIDVAKPLSNCNTVGYSLIEFVWSLDSQYYTRIIGFFFCPWELDEKKKNVINWNFEKKKNELNLRKKGKTIKWK